MKANLLIFRPAGQFFSCPVYSLYLAETAIEHVLEHIAGTGHYGRQVAADPPHRLSR